jgi:hypothetical protein
MLRHRNKLIAAASVLALTGGVAISSLTAASASPAKAATERFQLVTSSTTSNKASFIAIGSVLTAVGVDHQGNGNVDKIVFRGGTFKIRHSSGTGKVGFNPRTCVTSGSIHGTYKVYGGTGKYAGIRGHGKYEASILFVFGRTSKGACQPGNNARPIGLQQIIRASGPLTL